MTARCICRWSGPAERPPGWAAIRIEHNPRCPEHAETKLYLWTDGRLHEEPDTRDVGKHGGCG